MHTNTSSPLTAFSDLAPPADHPLHPAATQMHDYLRAYATTFEITERIRFQAPVGRSHRGGSWTARASTRWCSRPAGSETPGSAGACRIRGRSAARFRLPGIRVFTGRRTLVYGNGVSGLEIASDLARVTPVVSSFRKARTSCRRSSMVSPRTGSGTQSSAPASAATCHARSSVRR